MQRPTVKDVARVSGLSLATVDRVLNRRASVREQTAARVESAISALGYVRDVSAANLASGRSYRIVFVIPDLAGGFHADLQSRIRAARALASTRRTQVRIVTVPPFDAGALACALSGLTRATACGVAVVATDHPAVSAAIARLRAAGVRVVTLVSDAPSACPDAYVGIDNRAAGRSAASLLGRFLGSGARQKVAIVAGSLRLADHADRLRGFSDVMTAEFAHLNVLTPIEGNDDGATVQARLAQLLARHDIAGIYSLGAGNRGVAAALQSAGLAGRVRTVVHELTPPTRTALAEGIFDAVINQDAGHEVRSAIRIIRALEDGLPIDPQQEHIRIDIYMRDNLPPAPQTQMQE